MALAVEIQIECSVPIGNHSLPVRNRRKIHILFQDDGVAIQFIVVCITGCAEFVLQIQQACFVINFEDFLLIVLFDDGGVVLDGVHANDDFARTTILEIIGDRDFDVVIGDCAFLGQFCIIAIGCGYGASFVRINRSVETSVSFGCNFVIDANSRIVRVANFDDEGVTWDEKICSD